jgi:hypothetical protein
VTIFRLPPSPGFGEASSGASSYRVWTVAIVFRLLPQPPNAQFKGALKLETRSAFTPSLSFA